MVRRLCTVLLAALVAGLSMASGTSGAQEAPPPPPLGMAAGILIHSQSGKVIWAREDQVQRPPASLTKVLAALVILERANLDETATITPEARNIGGGRTYAEQGWTFTVRDLLWGLMLQSGNDSAIALAQKVSPDGTVAGFVKLMNETATRIGAKSSNFVNPHGLDEPGHLSTARDLALITMAAMRNQFFAEMAVSKTHDVVWGDGTPHSFINHNKLLWRYPGAIGVKTGYTAGAGNSLISAVHRDGVTLIAVALGSPDHYAESIALFDWAFPNLGALTANPTAVIRPAARTRETLTEEMPAVVQVEAQQEQEEKSAGGIPPALAPMVALAAALALAQYIRKRRQRVSDFESVDEFRDALAALGTQSRVTFPNEVNGDRDHPAVAVFSEDLD